MLSQDEKVALIASLPSSLRLPESLLAELFASPPEGLPAPLTKTNFMACSNSPFDAPTEQESGRALFRDYRFMMTNPIPHSSCRQLRGKGLCHPIHGAGHGPNIMNRFMQTNLHKVLFAS